MKKGTDEQVFKLIREGKPADEILSLTGISRGTLQKKYIFLVQKENAGYKVNNLFAPPKYPKISKRGGVLISNNWLEGAAFAIGQEFDVGFTKDGITLKKK